MPLKLEGRELGYWGGDWGVGRDFVNMKYPVAIGVLTFYSLRMVIIPYATLPLTRIVPFL